MRGLVGVGKRAPQGLRWLWLVSLHGSLDLDSKCFHALFPSTLNSKRQTYQGCRVAQGREQGSEI